MSNFDPYHLFWFWNPFLVLDMCKLVFVYKMPRNIYEFITVKTVRHEKKLYTAGNAFKYPTLAKLWITLFWSKLVMTFYKRPLKNKHTKHDIDGDKITQFWDNPNKEIWLPKFKYLGLGKVWLVLLSMCLPINFTFL